MLDRNVATKSVFIASPTVSQDVHERRRSDAILKYIIQPALNGLVNNISYSNEVSEAGLITTQLIQDLLAADVVIADITGVDPNVMYLVGIRQAKLKPYVLIAEDGQNLPFALSEFRTVFYKLDLDGAELAQDHLREMLVPALQGEISVADSTLFSEGDIPQQNVAIPQQTTQREFLELLNACGKILHETQEVKELLNLIGTITFESRDIIRANQEAAQQSQSQEMGKWLFEQMFANPEHIDKVLPLMEKFAEIGAANNKFKE